MITEAQTRRPTLTIKDIAQLAGVSKSAVSGVLNNRPMVGKTKQAKILEMIKKYNYVPQMSARTLATNRTYQIGFLISSRVTLGLSNAYFSTIESGVSEACKRNDYQMLVSTYDLSDIKTFVMPKKLKQRSIDGLIVAGNVSQDVLAELKSQNIPFIMIGGTYNSEDILALSSDVDTTYINVIRKMIDYGHHSFCYASSEPAGNSSFSHAVSVIRQSCSEPLQTDIKLLQGDNEYENGVKLAKDWIKLAVTQRYTILMANDQVCCGFLSELLKNNIKCPDEVSVISGCDTFLCEWSLLPISAISAPLLKYGSITTELLIDMIEKRKTLSEVKQVLDKEHCPCALIERKTTSSAPRI